MTTASDLIAVLTADILVVRKEDVEQANELRAFAPKDEGPST